jgi:hypothetical protein
MFKKSRLAEETVKAVVIDEFELCVEADAIEAEKSYFRLLDEGKLLTGMPAAYTSLVVKTQRSQHEAKK